MVMGSLQGWRFIWAVTACIGRRTVEQGMSYELPVPHERSRLAALGRLRKRFARAPNPHVEWSSCLRPSDATKHPCLAAPNLSDPISGSGSACPQSRGQRDKNADHVLDRRKGKRESGNLESAEIGWETV